MSLRASRFLLLTLFSFCQCFAQRPCVLPRRPAGSVQAGREGRACHAVLAATSPRTSWCPRVERAQVPPPLCGRPRQDHGSPGQGSREGWLRPGGLEHGLSPGHRLMNPAIHKDLMNKAKPVTSMRRTPASPAAPSQSLGGRRSLGCQNRFGHASAATGCQATAQAVKFPHHALWLLEAWLLGAPVCKQWC